MEENKDNIKKGPKKTWIIIAGIIALIAIPLIIFLSSKNLNPLSKDNVNEKTTTARTSLSVSEDIRTISEGNYETDIIINSNGDKISGAQIELAFEPTLLTNVDITPGNFLNSPTVLTKTIDTTNGVIRYILAIKPGGETAEGTGVLATLSFTKTSQEPTNIGFLPTSQVSTTGLNQSILKETISADIQ